MQVCDFSRSFFTFRVDIRGKKPITVSHPVVFTVNNARCPIEACCRVTFAKTGQTIEYVLGGACKTEQVNVTRGVWHQPNADMCMIVGGEHFMTIKSWDRNNKGVKLYPPTLGDQPERHIERIADAFDSIRVDLRYTPGRLLEKMDDIIAAGLSNRSLVSTTDYAAPDGSTVHLEYPIKVLNISEVDHYYQTDTGPILWPDLAGGWGENPIHTLRRAFIAHNSPTWAELIVEMPTPLADTISVNHYSRPERIEVATNRVIQLPD